MSAKEQSHFEDNSRKGTKIALSKDDTLCQQNFVTRSCEIKAIQNWALENGIYLKNEFYFQPARGLDPAFVITYDYNLQTQRKPDVDTASPGLIYPKPKPKKRVLDLSNQPCLS